MGADALTARREDGSGLTSKVFSRPKARSPVLVCGLPGSGYVGKLGADHLISIFKAKRIAEYQSDSFPPQVNVKEDGRVEPLKAELFYAHTGQPKDILVSCEDEDVLRLTRVGVEKLCSERLNAAVLLHVHLRREAVGLVLSYPLCLEDRDEVVCAQLSDVAAPR
jgi:proteasome assembly chaperone (PAC2) family protein